MPKNTGKFPNFETINMSQFLSHKSEFFFVLHSLRFICKSKDKEKPMKKIDEILLHIDRWEGAYF